MDPLCRLVKLAFAVFAVLVVSPAAPPVVAATSPSPSAGDTFPAAPTPPPNQRVTFAYKTFLGPAAVDYYGIDNFNVVFGTMTLTFNPDKTIEGRYEPDNGTVQAVTGNRTPDGNLTLQIGNQRYTGHFTRRGFACSTSTVPGMGFRLWGQFVHA